MALFVPFTQVTVCKLHSARLLLLFFPLVDLCLNVLGLLLGLVGLVFCASSLLHLSDEPVDPLLFISKLPRYEGRVSGLPTLTVL